jgi:hypothetical protein
VPDEHSNLKSPAPAARAGGNRRRGRRGGRGRSPRPVIAKAGAPGPEEISPAPETLEPNAPPEAAEQADHHEADSSGDFREPHAEAPADFASHETEPVEKPVTEPAAENFPAPEARAPREPPREFPRDRRPDRRPEPPRQRQWARPADFRPAETSAISEAVAHATEIAGSLKQMIDQLDEVLELVEVAERQKLADEREIDELRRALRRIQPPRRELPPPRREPLPSRPPRRDEPRPVQPVQQHEEPPRPPEAEEPPAHAD